MSPMKEKISKILLKTMVNVSPKMYRDKIFKQYKNVSFNDLERAKVKAEPFLLEFLLDDNSILFDVGAHIGEYVLFGNVRVPFKKIYAFEPHEDQYKKLTKAFSDANIYNLALSNENGIQQFKVPILKGKAQTTRGTLKVEFKEKEEQSMVTFDVQVRTIDSFCEEHNIPNISLIKVDVEGAEMDVVEGAIQTIKKCHPDLILELEKRHLGGSINETIEKVKQLGYLCYYYRFDDNKLIEVPANADNIQDEVYHKVNPVKYVNNFIFVEKNEQTKQRIDQINKRISDKVRS